MALFIHEENQKLLWETINKSPLIIQPIFQTQPNKKSEWFRGIVKQVYYSIPSFANRVLSRDELQQYNRSAISTMLTSLQISNRVHLPSGGDYHVNLCSERLSVMRGSGSGSGTGTGTGTPKNTFTDNTNNPVGQSAAASLTPVSILKEPMTEFSRNTLKKDEFQEQFSNRQKDYETMFQKPIPKEINFAEQMEEGVITNMEELIQRQKRQREMEISPQFTVGVAPPALPIPPPPPQVETLTKRLQITDEIPSEIVSSEIMAVELNIADMTIDKSWRETILTEMENMRKQIEVLQENLSNLLMTKQDAEASVVESAVAE
jgi:hypothetical protein